jgi:hypothetical protein
MAYLDYKPGDFNPIMSSPIDSSLYAKPSQKSWLSRVYNRVNWPGVVALIAVLVSCILACCGIGWLCKWMYMIIFS